MRDFRFKITNGGEPTYTDWYSEPGNSPAEKIAQLRFIYPNATFQIERGTVLSPPPSNGNNLTGVTSLKDDLNPTLSADLKLNSHAIVGSLDKTTLVVDGGLL